MLYNYCNILAEFITCKHSLTCQELKEVTFSCQFITREYFLTCQEIKEVVNFPVASVTVKIFNTRCSLTTHQANTYAGLWGPTYRHTYMYMAGSCRSGIAVAAYMPRSKTNVWPGCVSGLLTSNEG